MSEEKKKKAQAGCWHAKAKEKRTAVLGRRRQSTLNNQRGFPQRDGEIEHSNKEKGPTTAEAAGKGDGKPTRNSSPPQRENRGEKCGKSS